MADPSTNNANPTDARGFPFITVLASLATFFAFLGLMVLIYDRWPNPLREQKTEPNADQKADPAPKLEDIRARNQALLDGIGAKMSVDAATAELLGKLKSEKDRLPFPLPESQKK